MTAEDIAAALSVMTDPQVASTYSRFFKTGPGHYAEGDLFVGVTIPEQRKVAKEFWNKISPEELLPLLSSEIHEHRSTALFILILKFEKTKSQEEKNILADFYFQNRKFVNNWDLVDNSAYKILGRQAYETGDSSRILFLAEEESLWSKRIAIVSTMYFVRRGSFDLMKKIVLKNLQHPHDLMHKANGWLLREMGKKDEAALLDFLREYYPLIPRTTLRYAIEKLEESQRQEILKGRI